MNYANLFGIFPKFPTILFVKIPKSPTIYFPKIPNSPAILSLASPSVLRNTILIDLYWWAKKAFLLRLS